MGLNPLDLTWNLDMEGKGGKVSSMSLQLREL